MSSKYRKLLVFWSVLFTISMVLVFAGMGSSLRSGSGGLDVSNVEPEGPEDPDGPDEDGFNLSLVLAVIMAVASGGGFVATTYFAMREDRREAALHQLQIESLKKEIEHKDLEIARLRQKQQPPPPAPE